MKYGKYNNPRTAIRIPRETLEKLKYVADYNGRTANKEVEFIAVRYISEFEKEHGVIQIQETD